MNQQQPVILELDADTYNVRTDGYSILSVDTYEGVSTSIAGAVKTIPVIHQGTTIRYLDNGQRDVYQPELVKKRIPGPTPEELAAIAAAEKAAAEKAAAEKAAADKAAADEQAAKVKEAADKFNKEYAATQEKLAASEAADKAADTEKAPD